MFPAPTTIAIWTPPSWTSLISRAIRSTSRRSRPYSCSPISASPESFRSTRPKTGRAPFPSTRKGVTDEVEHLGVLLVQRLPDRRAVVDPFLVEQHVLAEEALAEHSLDDLVAHLLGLRLDLLRALEDIPLRPELLGRNLVPRRVARRRERDVHCQLARQLRRAANLHEHADLVRRRVHVRADRLVALTLEAGRAAHGDVLADLADELDALVLELLRGVWAVALDGLEDPLGESEELLVLRHRLGLATDSDQRASVLGDPREDDALGGLPAGALACLGHPALAQKPLRGLDVAAGLLQGALAVHHSGARLLAEVDDEQRVGLALEVGDAAEVRLQLLQLAEHGQALLRGQEVELALLLEPAQLVKPLDPARHRSPVRDQAAEPAVVDVRHANPRRRLLYGVLSLPLRPDEQDGAALRREVAREAHRLLEQVRGLLQIDDVDAAALREDEAAHLWIPASRLVAEMDTGLQQLSHRDSGQRNSPLRLTFASAGGTSVEPAGEAAEAGTVHVADPPGRERNARILAKPFPV